MARDDDDGDDTMHRQETVLEKSDRLAREYQREVRAREDRVRRIDDDPRRARSRSSSSSSSASKSTRPREARARTGSSERSKDRSRSDRSADRSKDRAREPSRERIEDGSDRLSDPFPPLKRDPKKRPPPQQRSGLPPKKPRQRPDLPRERPVSPDVTEPPGHGPMDLLAMELEEQVREARFGWRSMRNADRVTLICAVFVIAGVLMPWRSDPAHPMQIGLLCGGVMHLAIALSCAAIVIRSVSNTGMRGVKEDLLKQRRLSLWLVILGAASTFLGAFLLLLFGLEKAPDWPVRIHFGVYWTLVSGTGLSYGGFARFAHLTSR